MNIFDRLSSALELDVRREYTWAKGIGIGRGVISALKESNAAPGWSPLSAIRKAERLSLPWLIEGRGEKFEVNRYVTDADCANDLGCMLPDEPWTIVIATDGSRLAIVLQRPGEGSIQGRNGRETPYRYTHCEIMLGGGAEALATVARLGERIFYAVIPADRMDAIYRAQAGTWRLLLAPDAWLRDARAIAPNHAIFSERTPEPRRITREEEIVLKCFSAMEPAQRETYKAIGNTLAKPNSVNKEGNGK